MKQISTKAMICLDDGLGLTYRICTLVYTLYEDDRFTYCFTPRYSVIDLLPESIYQGIPGLRMELRKPQYVRENRTPVFISERTPGENREDLWKLLEDSRMNTLNRLEWLIRTDTRYSGDGFYVERLQPADENPRVPYAEVIQGSRGSALRNVLQAICAGHTVQAGDFTIDDGNRKAYYALLYSLYDKEKQSRPKTARQGKYRGRTPIPIDDTRLIEVAAKFKNRKITAEEAAAMLGVSRSTFFRKLGRL